MFQEAELSAARVWFVVSGPYPAPLSRDRRFMTGDVLRNACGGDFVIVPTSQRHLHNLDGRACCTAGPLGPALRSGATKLHSRSLN